MSRKGMAEPRPCRDLRLPGRADDALNGGCSKALASEPLRVNSRVHRRTIPPSRPMVLISAGRAFRDRLTSRGEPTRNVNPRMNDRPPRARRCVTWPSIRCARSTASARQRGPSSGGSETRRGASRDPRAAMQPGGRGSGDASREPGFLSSAPRDRPCAEADAPIENRPRPAPRVRSIEKECYTSFRQPPRR
jgi:hypothetical protein